MLRRQLTLLTLFALILLAACAPATTLEGPAALQDSKATAGEDGHLPDQAGPEPPQAILTIDGWKQTAGMTGYCWQQSDGTGICADGIGFTTPADPIPAQSTFLAEFEFLLATPPDHVLLSIFPATEQVAAPGEQGEWRYWRSMPGTQFTLPPVQDPLIELTQEPGLYVFSLSAEWLELGEATYGFLVDVGGALLQDTAAFAADQGLPMEEAMRRMRFQETIGDVQPLLMADLPDTFGGLWVEQEPAYRIVIALTEGDFETIRPYVAEYEWSEFVEVQPVNYSLETLRASQAIASQAADSLQVAAITAVDVMSNRVELIVGNPDLFLADLAQAGIKLPESVTVLASDPEGELPNTNRGVMLETVTSDDRVIYLPIQPPGGVSMMALMEGTLVEVNGCLRLDDGHYADGWLVIWPFGSDIRVTDDAIEVVGEAGNVVARVGDLLRASGGAVENSRGMAGLDEMIPGMPIEGCPGPYWVAAPLESMDEQSMPDIYFEPYSSGGRILAWFVNQSRPSPETESLSGQLVLDESSCLRLEEYLLILPPEIYLREDPLRMVDADLNEIAQIGDTIQVTGAEKDASDYRYFENKVQCPGPYWGVNEITAAR